MSYNVEFPGLGLNFSVNTDAFTIGNFSIKWYGVIIAIGFLLAFIYALRSCKAMNIDQNKLLDVVIVGIIFGVIGARLYYVLYYPGDMYLNDPIRIFYIHEGGLAIYGGVIGGLLGGVLMAKIRKVNIPAVLDIAVLGFLIGQGIGRWGNFVNQEAFGTECTNILRMQSEATGNTAVHPCFLYESVWCLVGFLILHIFTRKLRRYDGQTFLLYLLWYGVGRFFIEGLRTDSLIVFGTIRVSQLVAAVTAFAALILLFVFRRRTKLIGCGNKEVMELNKINDEISEGDVNQNEAPAFGTIFGDLGYEEPQESENGEETEETGEEEKKSDAPIENEVEEKEKTPPMEDKDNSAEDAADKSDS